MRHHIFLTLLGCQWIDGRRTRFITIASVKHGSLLKVRNKCGVDVVPNHHLVGADIRLKIAFIKKNNNKAFSKDKVGQLITDEEQ
jgi:hypothetical protein